MNIFLQETVQERLRRERPSLFGPYLNPDVIMWRDDPRWNDPYFRHMQVARDMNGLVTGPESYFVLVYCKEEGRHFIRASNIFFNFLISQEPRPAFWIKFVETAIKVNEFVEDMKRSHRKALCHPFSYPTYDPLSSSLLGRIVKIIILFSPLVLLSKAFSICRHSCTGSLARDGMPMIEGE